MTGPGVVLSSAVVTGASRGIGLAIAGALVARGVRVAMLARSADRLRAERSRLGPLAVDVPVDLTTDASVDHALRTVESSLGLPDAIVSCAGVFPMARIGSAPATQFESTLASNLIGPYRLIHAYVPRLRQRGRGHLVTIGSVADRVAYPENAAYAASKFGTRAVHEVLRAELRGSGVRATLVSPGPVNTPLWDSIDPDARSDLPSRSDMLVPEDVADAVVWVLTRPARVNIDELRLTHQ